MAGEQFGGGVQRVPGKIQIGKVFMSAHGKDTVESVTGMGVNRAGFPLVEIPEGQVITWAFDVQRWMPHVQAPAAALVSSANVITLAEPRRFTVGDLVHIAGVGYRNITRRDSTSITVDGAAFSIAAGALVTADGGLSRGVVASISGAVVTVDDTPSGFRIGQRVTIGDGANILAFTPTVANSTPYAVAARVLSTGEVIPVPITSGGSATAQAIVEALKAAGDGIAAFAALVTLTEDNAKLYAQFDPAVVEVFALTANLATANVSRGGIISAINNGANTITLTSSPFGVVADDVIVAEEIERHYRITCSTVALANLANGYSIPNPDLPTQPHGEVRERLVNGLTAAARAYLEAGGIRFNNTAH